MPDKIRVRHNGMNLRMLCKDIKYCHVLGNDLVLYSDDGLSGEIKDCSMKKFRDSMSPDFLTDFVEVKCGHLVHESLIKASGKDCIEYDKDIFKCLHERGQNTLKNLTPSRSGQEELEKIDIIL